MAYLVFPSSYSSTSTLNFLNKDTSINSLLSTTHLHLHNRTRWEIAHSRKDRHNVTECRVEAKIPKLKDAYSSTPPTLVKEAHKYFDQVIITVRSGDGGHGAILNMPYHKPVPKMQGKHKYEQREKKKKSPYRRDSNGSLILPIAGHGGDVVIFADEGIDTLLEFHKKNRYSAKRGGNVDAMGTLNSQLHDGFASTPLRIPVPVGTVVKRKRGTVLADLSRPGDEILVARGGQGGISLLEMPEHQKKKLMTVTTGIMRDDNDKVFVLGQPGEEVSLELILRVVADVGLVGLPNAGKSTLLGSITLAKPDIADYPFTTLMPNLGRLNGDASLGAGMYSSETTLADLPGLIEGAHLGKGLGRNFLRHLRRTRLLVHVVDAASVDPVHDYRIVRQELLMYNPEYLERPYVVVLNKIDLSEACERLPSLTREISAIGCSDAFCKPETCLEEVKQAEQSDTSLASSKRDRRDKEIEEYARPLAVVGVSVLKGIKIDEMLKEIRAALRKCQGSEEVLALSSSVK